MLHICSDETIHHKRSSRRVGHPPRNLAAMDCRKEDFRPENPESRRAEFSFMDETGHSAGQESNRPRKGEAMKRKAVLLSVFILWAAGVVLVDNYRVRRAVESARANERKSCDTFLRLERRETELQRGAAEYAQNWIRKSCKQWMEGTNKDGQRIAWCANRDEFYGNNGKGVSEP